MVLSLKRLEIALAALAFVISGIAQAAPKSAPPDLGAVLDATVATFKVVSRSATCDHDGLALNAQGTALFPPCAPVIARCPSGTMPINNSRKPQNFASCTTDNHSNTKRLVSFRKRNLSCSSKSAGGEVGYVDHCRYSGALLGEQVVIDRFSSCNLQLCNPANGVTTGCKPHRGDTLLARGVNSGTLTCVAASFPGQAAAVCPTVRVTARLACAHGVSARTLGKLGVPADK